MLFVLCMIGKVVLKCRTWPGSPPNSNTDFWRGPGLHHSAYHEVFADGVDIPDLQHGIGKVPGAARAEHTQQNDYDAAQSKKTRDLQFLYEAFPEAFNPGDIAECRELLRMECIPLDEEIAFDWPQCDLDSLYGLVQKAPLHERQDDDDSADDSDDMHVPDRYVSVLPL